MLLLSRLIGYRDQKMLNGALGTTLYSEDQASQPVSWGCCYWDLRNGANPGRAEVSAEPGRTEQALTFAYQTALYSLTKLVEAQHWA